MKKVIQTLKQKYKAEENNCNNINNEQHVNCALFNNSSKLYKKLTQNLDKSLEQEHQLLNC